MRAITAEEIRKIAGGRGGKTSSGLKPMVVKGPPGSESNPIPLPSTPVSSTPSYPFDSGPYSNPYPSGPGGVPVSPPGGAPVPPSGGGGDGGASHGPYSYALNPVLGSKPITEYLQEADLLNVINALGVTVVAGQGPNETVANTASYNPTTNTIYIPTSDLTNYAGAVDQTMHEVGHALHSSAPMSNYDSKQSYVNAMLVDEGYAQEEAARGADNWASNQNRSPDQSDILPPADTVAESLSMLNTYNQDVDAGKTPEQIAADLAPMMGDQTLGDHSTTEREYYEEQWDEHH